MTATMEIMDMTGRVVLKINTTYAVTPVNIPDFANGVYMYRININGISKTGRIIKE